MFHIDYDPSFISKSFKSYIIAQIYHTCYMILYIKIIVYLYETACIFLREYLHIFSPQTHENRQFNKCCS